MPTSEDPVLYIAAQKERNFVLPSVTWLSMVSLAATMSDATLLRHGRRMSTISISYHASGNYLVTMRSTASNLRLCAVAFLFANQRVYKQRVTNWPQVDILIQLQNVGIQHMPFTSLILIEAKRGLR